MFFNKSGVGMHFPGGKRSTNFELLLYWFETTQGMTNPSAPIFRLTMTRDERPDPERLTRRTMKRRLGLH
jgi:hypothetical protein